MASPDGGGASGEGYMMGGEGKERIEPYRRWVARFEGGDGGWLRGIKCVFVWVKSGRRLGLSLRRGTQPRWASVGVGLKCNAMANNSSNKKTLRLLKYSK